MLNWMRNVIGGNETRIDATRAWELAKQGATLVDVRTPEEFRDGSVPGAVNIPVQVINGRMGEIDKRNPVVVFCRSGGRSASAASTLLRAGYEVYDAATVTAMRSAR